MPQSETGATKNVANFEDLINRLKAPGVNYSPSKPSLQLAQLESLLTAAKEAMRKVSTASPIYSKAVDDQELLFKPLNEIITRSLSLYKISINNLAELDTAKSLANKIRGTLTTKTRDKKGEVAQTENAEGVTKSISRSAQSYDNRSEHFKQYLDVLANSSVYIPTEEKLSLNSLYNLHADLEMAIKNVEQTKTNLDDARTTRYNLLYAPQSGLVSIAFDVKTYARAALEKNHPQYKPIQAIEFKNRK